MRTADWTGRVGETWAREWRRTDRSFAGLDETLVPAILAVAPSGRARLVDIGCGAGTTSLAITRARRDAEVIGLDLSPDLVAVAGDRAANDDPDGRCRFVVGDAVALAPTLAPVDRYFSRHGVMFFADPASAFARFAAAAAPGARLIFSCFAAVADNPWATETLGSPPAGSAAPQPGPFAFADPERVAAILAAAGWAATAPRRVAFRYVAGAGDDPVADALSFFGRIGPAAAALRTATDAERPALLDRLAKACRDRCEKGEVAFPAAAWLWSAQLQEPAR